MRCSLERREHQHDVRAQVGDRDWDPSDPGNRAAVQLPNAVGMIDDSPAKEQIARQGCQQQTEPETHNGG